MVERRLLDAAFVDAARAPERSERWVADTQARGFGLRLWRGSDGASRAAFALRCSDAEGRPRRRTFDPWSDGLQAWLDWRRRQPRSGAAGVETPPLSIHLDGARRWAEREIARLKHGEAPEDVDARRRASDAERLSRKSLLDCTERVLEAGGVRGWSQAYADRLRSALHAGLPADLLAREVGSFAPGEFAELFEALPLASGNRRLIRGLLHPVFDNLRALAGAKLSLSRSTSHWAMARRGVDRAEEIEWLRSRRSEDVEALIEAIRDTQHGWRARTGLELCFRLRAPVSRVLAGRWDQVEGRLWRWLPLQERWWVGSRTLSACGLSLLEHARRSAVLEGISSDYWLPGLRGGAQPIRSLNRPWKAVLRGLNWPSLTLGLACRELWFDGEATGHWTDE